MNSQLINMEAKQQGYDEGIALDTNGYVSEGSGENLFLVKDKKLVTPPLGASVLPGITRDCMLKLVADLSADGQPLEGYEVLERIIPRELLYLADEVFFVGTAAEVTPVREIDDMKIGSGTRGPVTKILQDEYKAVRASKAADRHNWLTFV